LKTFKGVYGIDEGPTGILGAMPGVQFMGGIDGMDNTPPKEFGGKKALRGRLYGPGLKYEDASAIRKT